MNQKISQFGGTPGIATGDARGCLPFEAMLADAVDGMLSPEDQRLFDEHLQTCESCPAMLADARRGLALLEVLRADTPEPPAALPDRILAQTSALRTREEEAARAERRAAQEAASLLGRPVPPALPLSPSPLPGGKVLPFRPRLVAQLQVTRHTVLQPRFAMTAAMAFFSIALTLNLTGIRLGELRASDLRPGNVRRNLYEAEAHVVRYYSNLRVVYELESRVRDLQRAGENGAPTGHGADTANPAEQTAPAETGTDHGKPGPATGGQPAAAEPQGKSPNKSETKPRPKPNSGTSRCDPEHGAHEFGCSPELPRSHPSPVAVAYFLPYPAVLCEKGGWV